MVYNLKRLSITYVRGFKGFIKEKGLSDWPNERQYNLISYAICKMYGLEAGAYAGGTSTYGRSCTKYMSVLKSTPKHKDKISFAEKVELLCMVQAYFVSTFIGKSVKEVVSDGDQDAL